MTWPLLYCCWPVIRRPSRMANGLNSPAWMKFAPRSSAAVSMRRMGHPGYFTCALKLTAKLGAVPVEPAMTPLGLMQTYRTAAS